MLACCCRRLFSPPTPHSCGLCNLHTVTIITLENLWWTFTGNLQLSVKWSLTCCGVRTTAETTVNLRFFIPALTSALQAKVKVSCQRLISDLWPFPDSMWARLLNWINRLTQANGLRLSGKTKLHRLRFTDSEDLLHDDTLMRIAAGVSMKQAFCFKIYKP